MFVWWSALRHGHPTHRIGERRFQDMEHLFEDVLLAQHLLPVAVRRARHREGVIDVTIGAQHEKDQV